MSPHSFRWQKRRLQWGPARLDCRKLYRSPAETNSPSNLFPFKNTYCKCNTRQTNKAEESQTASSAAGRDSNRRPHVATKEGSLPIFLKGYYLFWRKTEKWNFIFSAKITKKTKQSDLRRMIILLVWNKDVAVRISFREKNHWVCDRCTAVSPKLFSLENLLPSF